MSYKASSSVSRNKRFVWGVHAEIACRIYTSVALPGRRWRARLRIRNLKGNRLLKIPICSTVLLTIFSSLQALLLLPLKLKSESLLAVEMLLNDLLFRVLAPIGGGGIGYSIITLKVVNLINFCFQEKSYLYTFLLLHLYCELSLEYVHSISVSGVLCSLLVNQLWDLQFFQSSLLPEKRLILWSKFNTN